MIDWLIVGFLTFTSLHLSSSRPMTQTDLLQGLHLSLYLANGSALSQLFIPSLHFSVSTILLPVVFSRPTLSFTSGCHVNSVVQILLLSTRYLSSYLSVIISLAFVVSALQCRSWFNIVSGHLILNICLRHLFCNTGMSSFSLFYSVIFQVAVTIKWRTTNTTLSLHYLILHCPYIT